MGLRATEELNPKKAVAIRKNKSCSFILPLLGKPRAYFDGLINCYLGDEMNKSQYTLNGIFIHIKDYYDSLTYIEYFNNFYKLEDDTYIFMYDIPDKFLNDYHKFYTGKYSQMSEEAKDLICNFTGTKPIMNNIVYKVLYKTADQKEIIEKLIGEKLPFDAEVYSIPDLDKEVYNYHKIKRSNNIVKNEVKEIL